MADDTTYIIGDRMAVDGAKQFHECLNDGREECLLMAELSQMI
jgi:hypothetical protein